MKALSESPNLTALGKQKLIPSQKMFTKANSQLLYLKDFL